jgi:hypothetical protein
LWLKQSVNALPEADDKGVRTTQKDVRVNFLLALLLSVTPPTSRLRNTGGVPLGLLPACGKIAV